QLQRFKNEAQAAAGLRHTNIVPVHATGCERGVHYYAMQFIEGRTLATIIEELRRSSAGLTSRTDLKSVPPIAQPTGPYLPDIAPVTPPIAGQSTEGSIHVEVTVSDVIVRRVSNALLLPSTVGTMPAMAMAGTPVWLAPLTDESGPQAVSATESVSHGPAIDAI